MLFDLSDYRLRKLDPTQGTKPLDFGGGGITGSINLDGRFIAINTYHPEHGYITLTSIPPFPDADRYDQAKVRAYRKSLVTNEGFGLEFEQEIVEREYYLIEDAVPFIRFTLADGTVAECLTTFLGMSNVIRIDAQIYDPIVRQYWKFSIDGVKALMAGRIWLRRTDYTQLTEGGIIPAPSHRTNLGQRTNGRVFLDNEDLQIGIGIQGVTTDNQNNDGSIDFEPQVFSKLSQLHTLRFMFNTISESGGDDNHINKFINRYKQPNIQNEHPLISRSKQYSVVCNMHTGCMLTDHMILPLLWNRDSYYVAKNLLLRHPSGQDMMKNHLEWLFNKAWRGTYWKKPKQPLKNGWARSYMANGMAKDNKAFQFDQQLYPFLELAEYFEYLERTNAPAINSETQLWGANIEAFMSLVGELSSISNFATLLISTDETPADDDLDFPFHFSTTILLWYILKKLLPYCTGSFQESIQIGTNGDMVSHINKYFITEHNGKQIYSYATDGEGNHYIYHDANDIPLVMMPLWGFCDKDNEIWLNTIEFAFSDANPGFYDRVLGSVHTPAPWALGDAQELIYCKVVGDRERYQRVWQRLEKAMQWDGALPEAYDATTFEVVSRHWFAWPNAMVAIADSISWDWETEGEYAR